MKMHTKETKEEAVKKYLNGTTAIEIASEIGVSPSAIYVWTKRLGKSRQAKTLQPLNKADLVIEYQRLDDTKRGEWLRTNGYESAHLEQWISELDKEDKNNKELKDENRLLKEQLKKLEKKLLKKDKALAESAALLVLKKSTNTFGRTRSND